MRKIRQSLLILGFALLSVVGIASPAAADPVPHTDSPQTFHNDNNTFLGRVSLFGFNAAINSQHIQMAAAVQLTTSVDVQRIRFRPVFECHLDRNDNAIRRVISSFPLVVLDGNSASMPVHRYPDEFYVFSGTSDPVFSCNVIKIYYHVTFVGNSGQEYTFRREDYFHRF